MPAWEAGRGSRGTACVYSACPRQAGALTSQYKHPDCLSAQQGPETGQGSSGPRLPAPGSVPAVPCRWGRHEPDFTEHLVRARPLQSTSCHTFTMACKVWVTFYPARRK